MINTDIKNILAADCGTATTAVVLIELIGETYHLAAHAEALSTHGAPWFDLTLGMTDAIKQLEQQTGQRLLDHSGSLIRPRSNSGDGVDALVVATSAAQPLHVSVVGLMNHLSLESARRAVNSTYAVVDYQIGSDDRPENRSVDARVKALQQAPADLILLVGGADGGAAKPIIELAQTIAMALRVMKPGARPQIIYAGNSHLRTEVADILAQLTNFKSVDNIRPAPEQEALEMVQAELHSLYSERKIAQLPGVQTLAEWSYNIVAPSARSFAQTIQYIGQTYNVLTIGADVGSAATTIAVKRGHFQQSTTRADIGLGHNAPALLAQTAWENFQRWLPFEISPADFNNFTLNKGLFPHTVPQTYQEVWLELALMREALQLVSAQARQSWSHTERREADWFSWDLIIGAGRSLTHMLEPAGAALALLDGLAPAGICRLVLDIRGIAGMLGGLANVQPVAAAQIVDEALQFTGQGPFLNLGMVVAPVGVGRFGDTALQVQVEYAEGREVELKIPFGAIEVIPLKPNEEATLKIRPSRYFSLSPHWGQPGREVKATVNGGVLGLIIDARGRPISLAQNKEDRARQLREWLSKLRVEDTVVRLDQLEVELDVGQRAPWV